MAQIDRIIEVKIDLTTSTAEAEDISLPLLVGEASEFPSSFTDQERVRSYNDLSSMASDGFATTSNIYKLARSMFMVGAISQILIGKKIDSDVSYEDALNKIIQKNNDWYGLVITSRNSDDILSASDFCESNNKLGSFASSDEEIIDSTVDDDIASIMKSKSYKNCYITYHSKADIEFIDGASLSDLLGSQAGNYALAYKTFNGIEVDKISDNALAVLESKKCNYYIVIAKNNKYQSGTTPSSQMVALTRDLFWFKRAIQLALLNKFFTNTVIRLNPRGIAILESGIVDVCDQAIQQEVMREATKTEIAIQIGIAEDKVVGYRPAFGYVLVMPDITNPMNFDKATKTLKNIVFVGKVADEIHRLSLDFKLSL